LICLLNFQSKGTLTQNKMSVKELYIGEDINDLENPKDLNEELAHRYSEAYNWDIELIK